MFLLPIVVRKSYTLLFFFLLTTFSFFGQNFWKTSNYPNGDSVISALERAYSLELKKSQDKDALTKTYDWRLSYLTELLNSETVIYNDSLVAYFDSFFRVIIQANPELHELKLRYFISNSPVPNAMSIGDGTFVINLGLIRKLDNEAQLAFVLCHEIAHFYLDHSNQSSISDYKRRNTKEYKKEVDEVNHQEFGRYQSIQAMMKKEVYHQMSHSRVDESEADSLGLQFLRNTKFSPIEAITCMNLLDTIDTYKYSTEIDYKTMLGFEGCPFRDRWLESESSMFGGQVEGDYWERDSVKSHPDCSDRAKKLTLDLVNTPVNSTAKFLNDSLLFFDIKEQSDEAFIKSWVFYGNYSKALFYTLKQVQYHPNNEFLVREAGLIMRLIYQVQLEHHSNQFVERPFFENEKEYNQFLDFLDNLRLSELAKIGYYYHLTYLSAHTNDEEFQANFNYFKTKTNN